MTLGKSLNPAGYHNTEMSEVIITASVSCIFCLCVFVFEDQIMK